MEQSDLETRNPAVVKEPIIQNDLEVQKRLEREVYLLEKISNINVNESNITLGRSLLEYTIENSDKSLCNLWPTDMVTIFPKFDAHITSLIPVGENDPVSFDSLTPEVKEGYTVGVVAGASYVQAALCGVSGEFKLS